MGMRARRQALVTITAVVAAVAFLGGCGSSSTESGAGGGTSSTAPATTTATGGPGTSAAAAAEVDIVVISTPFGDALGTDDGRVLYAWDTEADGTIACVDAGCVETWPPLLADSIGDVGGLDPARFTLVERPDGSAQVAIDARPLYHMAVDEPGEATCQGVEGWWILNPDGTKNTNETPRSDATPTTAVDVPGY
jgi:predicted lipoprotein with Yx(FWY)xxD motif